MHRVWFPARVGVVAVIVVAVCAVLTGCSGSDADDGELSPEASAGAGVAAQVGCRGCHSVDGRDGVGPTWKDLYGSEVTLEDGTTVTADEEYLRRAIVDPGAETVAGYRTTMPKVSLDDDQVDQLVAYIKELSPSGEAGS